MEIVATISSLKPYRTFLVVWSGQLISGIGSNLTRFALGFWVFAETGSTTQLALVIMAAQLPALLVSPFAGALVDRWSRRITMILSDTGAALGTLVIAVLVATNSLEIWHLYVALGLSGASGALQFPAYTAATTLLVPRRHHARAAGLVQLARSAGIVLGPFFGAALLVLGGLTVVFVVDLVTFVVAIAILAVVRFPEPEWGSVAAGGIGGLLSEARTGFAYVVARKGLLGLMVTLSLVNFAISFHGVLIFPLLLGFTTAAAAGATISIGALGMVAGSATMSIWGGPQQRIRGLMIALAAAGGGLIVAGMRPSSPGVTTGLFIMLFSLPIAAGTSQAIWQSKIPPELQGRVFSLQLMTELAATPLAFLLAGPLADGLFEPLLAADGALTGSLGQLIGAGTGRGIGLLFIVLGLCVVLIVAAAAGNQHIRNIETEVPDVILDPPVPAPT